MTKTEDRAQIISLFPRLGLTTIDSTSLRYDPDSESLVCFVATDGEGVRIGWDMCGGCHLFVSTCRCEGGPQEPAYIYRLRTGEAPPKDHVRPTGIPSGARQPLSSEGQKRVAKRVRENAVDRLPARAEVAPAAPRPARRVLTAPCATHTAESRLNPDGTFTCTVPGCEGVV